MTTLFTIDLTINMPDGGRHARHLVNLYLADMPADINQVASHLCDGNEAVQARKFAHLKLKRSEAWASPEGSLKVFALLSVSGEDAAFIKQVIAKYMDGFTEYLMKAGVRIFAPRASRPASLFSQRIGT